MKLDSLPFYHFQGIILVYDITTEDSFKHIAHWLQNIQDVSTNATVHELSE